MAYRYAQIGLGLLAVTAPSAMAHPSAMPHAHAHAHAEAQNYPSDPNAYNVDWKTVTDWKNVDYGNGKPKPEQPAPEKKPASYPQPAAPQYPEKPAPKPKKYQAPKPKPKPKPKPAPQYPAKQAPKPKKQKVKAQKEPKGGDKPKADEYDAPKPGNTPKDKAAGLAYEEEDLCHDFQGVSWGYNWVSAPKPGHRQDIEFVPMLKSLDQQWTSVWEKEAAAQNPKAVLAFNEPDQPTEANIPVAECVRGYKEVFQKGAPKGARLGSPGVTSNLEPGKGLDYLKQFIDQCDGCQIDFISVHYYGKADQFDYFERYINAAKEFKKPIWVTEYGLSEGTAHEQAEFLKKATKLLQQTPEVERYSPFKVGNQERDLLPNNEPGKAYQGVIGGQ